MARCFVFPAGHSAGHPAGLQPHTGGGCVASPVLQGEVPPSVWWFINPMNTYDWLVVWNHGIL